MRFPNCPSHVAEAIPCAIVGLQPALAAVRQLGPERVKWIGGKPTSKPYCKCFTCWSLDGLTHATERELLEAAGLKH